MTVSDPAANHLRTLVTAAGGRLWSPKAREAMGTSPARHEALVDRAGLHRDSGWLVVVPPRPEPLPPRSAFGPREGLPLPPPVHPSPPPKPVVRLREAEAHVGDDAVGVAGGPERVAESPSAPGVSPRDGRAGASRRPKKPKRDRPPRDRSDRYTGTGRGSERVKVGQATDAAILALIAEAGPAGALVSSLRGPGRCHGTVWSSLRRLGAKVVQRGVTLHKRAWLPENDPGESWSPYAALDAKVRARLEEGPATTAALQSLTGLPQISVKRSIARIGAKTRHAGRSSVWVLDNPKETP